MRFTLSFKPLLALLALIALVLSQSGQALAATGGAMPDDAWTSSLEPCFDSSEESADGSGDSPDFWFSGSLVSDPRHVSLCAIDLAGNSPSGATHQQPPPARAPPASA